MYIYVDLSIEMGPLGILKRLNYFLTVFFTKLLYNDDDSV